MAVDLSSGGSLSLFNGQKGQSQWDSMLAPVNLHTGGLVLPFTIAALEGREGASASVQLTYAAGEPGEALKDNGESPCGVMGFGWAYNLMCITVKDRSANLGLQAQFMLAGEGGRYPLHRRGEEREGVAFSSIEHPCWKFLYEREKETWRLTKEDGSVWTYGGEGCVEQGVCWDNWVGPSCAGGGKPFAQGWFLREIMGANQSRLTFSYQNVMEKLGASAYTRAMRMDAVVSDYGETVKFHYKPKEAGEYRVSFPVKGGKAAYQQKYEDCYLAFVEVVNPAGETMYTQQFGYELRNLGDGAECRKRFLTSVTQVDVKGNAMPPAAFSYEWDGSKAYAGMLTRMVYQTGAQVDYGYQTLSFENSGGSLAVHKPAPDWDMQMHYGPSYAVGKFTQGERLKFCLYEWDMGMQTLLDKAFAGEVVSDAQVFCGNDFFGVCYRDKSKGFPRLRLFRRSAARQREWEATSYDLHPETEIPTVACGEDFLAMQYAKQNLLRIFRYSYTKNAWEETSVNSEAMDHQAIAAGKGCIFCCTAREKAKTLYFRLFYMDGANRWQAGPQAKMDQAVNWELTTPSTVWSVGNCSASATFAAVKEQAYVEAAVVLLRWSKDYAITSLEKKMVRQGGGIKNPLLYSRVCGDVTGFAENLFRYVPGGWKEARLTSPRSGAEYRYAYGNDLGLAVEQYGGEQRFFALRFDPFAGGWTQEGAPFHPNLSEKTLCPPVVAGKYAVLGRKLFSQTPAGNWKAVFDFPAYLNMDALQFDAEGGYFLCALAAGNEVRKYTLINGIPVEERRFPGIRGEKTGAALPAGPWAFYANAAMREQGTTLYALWDKACADKRTAAVVSSVSLSSGLGGVQRCLLEYETASARMLNKTPLFQRVRCVPVGAARPYGYFEKVFFNGLPGDSPYAAYPPDGEHSNANAFYSQFSGQLRQEASYDAAGSLSERSTYSIKALDPYGYVLRQRKILREQCFPAYDAATGAAGMDAQAAVQALYADYEPACYQLKRVTQEVAAPSGAKEIISQNFSYAFELYGELREKNVLNKQLYTLKRNESTGENLCAEAVLLKKCGDGVWREHKKLLWTQRGSPAYPREGGGADWYAQEEVYSWNGRGMPVDSLEASGIPGTKLYDREGNFLVAEFAGARREQALYSGFEPYEDLSCWSGAPASIQNLLTQEECFSGTRCLSLSGGQRAACSVRLPKGDGLLSLAYKLKDASGCAVELEAEGGQTLHMDLPPSPRWTVLRKKLPLKDLIKGESAQVTLTLRGPDRGTLLADAVFFTPNLCAGTAKVYAGRMRLQAAQHYSREGGSLSFYDRYLRPGACARDDGTITSIAQYDHQSYRAAVRGLRYAQGENPGCDAAYTFHAAGEDKLYDFCRGEDFLSDWNAINACVKGRMLVAQGGRACLSYKGETGPAYAAAFSFQGVSAGFTLKSGAVSICVEGGAGEAREGGKALCAFTAPQKDSAGFLLYRIGKRMALYYDGEELFRICANEGNPQGFSLETPGALHTLGLCRSPSMSVSFTDHTGRTLQSQAVTEEGVTASATMYSPIGQDAIKTKPVALPGLWGYASKLVESYDEKTGVMKGLAAEAYPEDKGYPYCQSETSRSPEPYPTKVGQAGLDASIHGPHHVRVGRYRVEQGSLPLGLEGVTADVVTEPDGRKNVAVFDGRGRSAYSIVWGAGAGAEKQVTAWEYDGLERKTKIYYPNYFSSLPDAKRFVAEIRYDFAGNVTERREPDSGTMLCVYDGRGLLHYEQDEAARARGCYHYRLYDGLFRETERGVCYEAWDGKALAKRAFAGGGVEGRHEALEQTLYCSDTEAVEPLDRVYEAISTDGGGRVTERFRYDERGNVAERTTSLPGMEETVYSAYNTGGQLLETRVKEHAIRYKYDLAGRLASVSLNGELAASYAYTPEMLIASERMGLKGGGQVSRSYAYDSNGRLTDIKDDYFRQSLSYDPGGRIIALKSAFQGAEKAPGDFLQTLAARYVYDSLGRLKGAELGAAGGLKDARFDPNGNLRQAGGRENAYAYGANRLAQAGDTKLSYGPDGSAVEISGPEDRYAFTYGKQSGRAVRVEHGASARSYGFGLDGAVWYDGGSGKRLLLRDGQGRLLLEAEEGGGYTLLVQGANGAFAQVREGKAHLLIKDYQGSVRGICGQSGLCAAYNYDVFGGFLGGIFEDGSTARLLPLRFTGQLLELGLYRFKDRWYDPGTGCFLSVDPAMQYSSPYLYGGGDWVNYFDPDGCWSWGSFFASLATIAVGVLMVLGGIAITVASAGLASPVGAVLATLGGTFVLGAGLGAACYGLAHVFTSDYNIWDCLISAGMSGVFAMLTAGIAAAIPAVSAGAATLIDVGVGVVTGAGDGFVTNGCINMVHGKDFMDGAVGTAIAGAVMGGLFSGLTGLGKAMRNTRTLRRAGFKDATLIVGAEGKGLVGKHACIWKRESGMLEGREYGYSGRWTSALDDMDYYESMNAGMKMAKIRLPNGRLKNHDFMQQYGRYNRYKNNCTTYVVDEMARVNLYSPLWARTPTMLYRWAKLLGKFQ